MSISARDYFKEELELITQMLAERQNALDSTPLGTPHPTCNCGKDMRGHLESDKLALKALQSLMENNVVVPLYERVTAKGLNYPSYAVQNLYRKGIETPEEEVANMQALMVGAATTLTKIGRWLTDNEEAGSPTPASIQGLYIRGMSIAVAKVIIEIVESSNLN